MSYIEVGNLRLSSLKRNDDMSVTIQYRTRTYSDSLVDLWSERVAHHVPASCTDMFECSLDSEYLFTEEDAWTAIYAVQFCLETPTN